MKLTIIIPAYNEGKVIASVLKSLPKKLKGVSSITTIVINDGSADNTYSEAKKHADHVAHHVVNLGAGAAVITGFQAAKKINSDLVVMLDADGQHNPENIEKLIEPIVQHKADIVIGTRMLNSKGMPKVKVFGNWAMNVMTLLTVGGWSTDTQSGMRAISRKALDKMQLHAVGFEYCSEIIGEAKRCKLKLKEVPIQTIYTEYSKAKGQSIINAVNIFTKLLTIRISGKK
ncbi:MAG: glycosyltransferase family 2 protein [Candidatus Berkelbacteria bacterium]